MMSRIQKYDNNHRKSHSKNFGKYFNRYCNKYILGIFGVVLTILMFLDNYKHPHMTVPAMTTEHIIFATLLGGLMLLVVQYGSLRLYHKNALVASINSIVRHLSNKFVLWILAYILIALCFIIYPFTLWGLIALLSIIIFYLFYPESMSITRETFGTAWDNMSDLRKHKFNGCGRFLGLIGEGILYALAGIVILVIFGIFFAGVIGIFMIGAFIVVMGLIVYLALGMFGLIGG